MTRTAPPITRLALVGPKHVGKTSLSNYLVNDHGWIRLGHADPLKDGAALMLSSFLRHQFPNALRDRAADGKGDWRGAVTRAEIDANKAAFVPLLQWLGEWLREYACPEADPLIEHLRWRVAQAATEDGRGVVVDDCRLPAEAAALREQGFFVLRLMRPEGERLESVVADLFNQLPPDLPRAERWRLANRRIEDIKRHGTETKLEAIVPDGSVWAHDAEELGVIAERIAAGREL